MGYASGPAGIRYAVPAAGMFLWFEMPEGFNAFRGMQTDGTDPQKQSNPSILLMQYHYYGWHAIAIMNLTYANNPSIRYT